MKYLTAIPNVRWCNAPMALSKGCVCCVWTPGVLTQVCYGRNTDAYILAHRSRH